MRAVLTYHSVDDSQSVISINPTQFRRHVECLARSTISVQPLHEIIAPIPLASPQTETEQVALTFDDGYMNFVELAWPVLQDHAMPATLFVVTDHVGRDNRWGGIKRKGIPVMPLVDWDALGKLSESGVDIGAHTRTHPHLPTLSDAAIEDELMGSADQIEQNIGRRPTALAFPFGATNARVEAFARQAFQVACSTEFRILRPVEDRARVPRLDAWYFRDNNLLESWGSSAFRSRIVMTHCARRVRRIFASD